MVFKAKTFVAQNNVILNFHLHLFKVPSVIVVFLY